jgi:hypothetical protein
MMAEIGTATTIVAGHHTAAIPIGINAPMNTAGTEEENHLKTRIGVTSGGDVESQDHQVLQLRGVTDM